jgi:SAM-dependent methyltransferase
MKVDRVSVSVNLPGWIYRPAKRMKKVLSRELDINLSGDRAVEWSFVSSYMPSGSGDALDFGSGGTHLSMIAARRGFRVTGLDLVSTAPLWEYEDLKYLQGDLLKVQLPFGHFQLIINCSSIEHVGLAGRYGVVEECPDGDLEAMAKMREAMVPGGVMLLTIPVGRDAVIHPLHRVYGPDRLPRLLEGFNVERAEFWVKSNGNRWHLCGREAALRFEARSSGESPKSNVYALGCFVMRRPA